MKHDPLALFLGQIKLSKVCTFLKIVILLVAVRRDYRVIEEVVDRDLWEKCRRGKLTSRREGGDALRKRGGEDAPRKREIKEETGSGSYREWKRSREDSGKNYREDGERNYRGEGERNHRGDDERNYRGEDPRRSSRDGSDRRERSHVRMNEEYSWQDERSSSRRGYSSRDYHRQLKRESEEEYRDRREPEGKKSRDRSGEEERWGSSLDTSHFSNDSGHGSSEGRGRETYYHDEDLEEVGRSGDFANWRTAVVKRDVDSRSREEESSTSVCPPPVERSDEEDIERLHK